ncbi:hypothetical protein NLJ89_g1317 [Agrocybe chaxingu]|uniref:G-protein coupled receptors family 1 profile domain-containing protein n=1 Tax=Agrocybe chaxingu TaxID=84603 RepID=A0A9W8N0C1_9AGAR|nr:hypothetical protein NLJ89_g1317 [Agrocybe chaxingu]
MGGAITVNVFAFLSTLALVSVALRVIWLAIQRYWFKRIEKPQEYVFFDTQLGQYAACLIIAMMFNTIAGIIGMPWLFMRGVTEGNICRSQALVMQIGNISAGYFTVTIAVHTFCSLVLKRRQSAAICRSIIALGWSLALFIAAAPFLIHDSAGFVYGADGLACGVRSIFPRLQFLFHLLPILIASTLGAVLYSLIYLVLRGTLEIKGGLKVTLNPHERWRNGEGLGENYHRFVARVARSMLWYPVAYIALLVPYSTMRLLIISGFNVPFEAVIFAFVCWYLLGVVDVLLLYNTFRVLGPAFDGGRSSASKDIEGSAPASPNEKYSPSVEEKVDMYRTQGTFPSRNVSVRSNWSASAKSTQNLIQHERSISDFSILTRPTPAAAMIGRSITPASDYNWVVSSPMPVTSPTTGGREKIISREASYSSTGLPAPPRRMRSLGSSTQQDTLSRQPSTRIDEESLYGGEWVSREGSTRTFGQYDSPRVPSWSSEELDRSGLRPNQRHPSSNANARALSVALPPAPPRHQQVGTDLCI